MFFFLCSESYDRDNPFGLALILSKVRIEGGLFCVESIVLRPLYLFSVDVDCFVSDFDPYVRMSLEVVVPVGISRRSSLRGEDEIAIALLQIHDGATRDLPLRAPMLWICKTGGPPTFPSFFRNSSIICLFQSFQLPLID